jgi:hypothetical protein
MLEPSELSRRESFDALQICTTFLVEAETWKALNRSAGGHQTLISMKIQIPKRIVREKR